MQDFFDSLLAQLLAWLALPQFGLSTVFVVSFISATLLPLGSEPAVYGLIKLQPGLFWPTVLVATVGNTLGGALNWWMGWGAHRVVDRATDHPTQPPPAPSERADGMHRHTHAIAWLQRFGPKACVLSWLPLVGDPLCAVVGWLKLPFWPCVAWMALGKFLRYLVLTAGLVWVF
ncbi:MAG: YqaA family protein [Burkholderiales bacterium]